LIFPTLPGIKAAMTLNLEFPLAHEVRRKMVRAIADYQLLSDGDKVMVCTSGGKDSSIMLALLKEIQKRAPFDFQIEAVLLDQKQPGFDASRFKDWVENHVGVKLHILERDTYSIVKQKTPEGGTFCTLCSKFRRAILYDFASANGFTKLALGHHRDDLNTTLLLNLFYSGKLSSMPVKLKSDDGRNILIRPMAYVSESQLVEIQKAWEFPVIPCNLCGSQENLKRKKLKQLLYQLEQDIPHIQESMLNAQGNIRKSQMLDHHLFDFKNLSRSPESETETLNQLPFSAEEEGAYL
jgi:tRNA 2-thiocytidine biosynthesis protein TtcA